MAFLSKTSLFLHLLVITTTINFVSASDGPIVQIEDGKLRGKTWTTRGQRTLIAFQGIPYAKPPLNNLRFKPPVPADPWDGIKDATKVHGICPQRDIYRRTSLIEGEEDCLYLNVYTPKLPDGQSRELLPVMVFFHGGGWLCGGGNSMWYGPNMLLDKDIVLVVPNYRLGALGFLSTEDKIVPGNNGMKDQSLVLQWVNKNIKSFGGDPQSVTLFGESAGGVSVQLHMMSPLSRGLFKGAISQSGTAQTLWGVAPVGQAKRHARMLAESFNCSAGSSQEILNCLKDIPAEEIVSKDNVFMKWDTDPMIPFKPVIEPELDGAFVSKHPIDYFISGEFSHVPWIVGVNKDDGALRAAGIVANAHLMEDLEKDFETVAPISLLYDETAKDKVQEITKKIKEFYLGDKKVDESAKSAIVDMYTDGWFLHGIDESIRYYLKYSKQPIYYYLFSHRGIASFTEIFGDKERDYGVCHADELQYLFPVGDGLFPDRPPTDADKKISNLLTTAWTNFAKTGDPTPETSDLIPEKWTPVTCENALEYFHIDLKDLGMRKELLIERTKFWRSLPLHERAHKINEIRDEL